MGCGIVPRQYQEDYSVDPDIRDTFWDRFAVKRVRDISDLAAGTRRF